jgi:ssDNA-binding replication factor A large subunit
LSPMYVTEIRPNKPVDELELSIVEVNEPRMIVTKYGKESRVCDAWAQDNKGDRVRLSLWNGDIDRVREGVTVRIVNGWARNYRDQLQVSAGLHGRLDVVE